MTPHSTLIDRAVSTPDQAAVVPDRLADVVDFTVLTHGPFTHRGHTVDPHQAVERLGCALQYNAGRMDAETVHPTAAVEIAVDDIATFYPDWFAGDPSLSKQALVEDWWQDALEAEVDRINLLDRSSRSRVTIPLMAIVVERALEHAAIDSKQATEEAKSEIKRTIIKQATNHGLSRKDINDAVTQAQATLEET